MRAGRRPSGRGGRGTYWERMRCFADKDEAALVVDPILEVAVVPDCYADGLAGVLDEGL